MQRSRSTNLLKADSEIKYKACVFDLDGVLRVGKNTVANTEYLLRHLNERGVKTMILTNECRYTIDELKNELGEIGLHIPHNTVVYTAACAARDYLGDKATRFPNTNFNICVIGEMGLLETIMELNYRPNITCTCRIDEDEDLSNTRLYLVLGTVNKIGMTHLNKLLHWVKKGAKIITTCKDTTDPSSKGDFNLGMPMHMLHMISYNVNKRLNSYSTGKPNPRIGEFIKTTYRDVITKPSDILFIGDTLYTDIQLAEESGFDSCLVMSGNTKKDALKTYVVEADYVLEDVSKLNDIL